MSGRNEGPSEHEALAHRHGAKAARTLDDLLALSNTAARLVARGKTVYDSDEAVRLAAEAVLHKIGEAVSRLPDDFVAAYPDVSWRSMKAMRNVVAHEYEQVDYEIVWNALARRLPGEMEVIRDLLGDRDKGTST